MSPARLAIPVLLACLIPAAAPAVPPFCGNVCHHGPGGWTIESGELDGVLYQLVVPESWSGDLLLIAHGHYPEEAPLSAEIDQRDATYRDLLSHGWMLAMSSYRRNGMIIEDAAEDLLALRSHVVASRGEPRRTLVEGWSMGAVVATLLCERAPEAVDGVLAIGAAYSLEMPGESFELTHRPQAPLLLLSNANDLQDPQAYATRASGEPFAPVLWSVVRRGYVNVNHSERGAALGALGVWTDGGPRPLDRDATVVLTGRESQAIVREGKRCASVVAVHPTYGNMDTGLVWADLQALGIDLGDMLTIACGERERQVLLGTEYDDVPEGRWVAFLTAEGYVKLARNMENAARDLGCAEGEMICISRTD